MKIFGSRGNRWRVAQKKEKEFWVRRGIWRSEAKRLEPSEEQRHLFQIELSEVTRTSVDNLKSKTILEIGGTHYAEIAAETVPDIEAIALDSLINGYPKYSEKSRFICGTAEKIPLKDKSVDICICRNAIDHMLSPGDALQEVRRVLKIDGKLYISCNVYSEWSRSLFPLFDLLDSPHPHHYSESSFLNLLRKNKYQIDFSFPVDKTNIRSLKGLIGKIHGLRHLAFNCSVNKKQGQSHGGTLLPHS